MKVEYKLFLFMAVFFGIVSAIYAWASMAYYGHLEPIGLTVFIMTFAMCAIILFYLFIQSRKIDPRYEDDPHGEVADGAGALGFFPPASIWPFACALVAAIILLGPVFGWWLTMLGVVAGIWAVTGWCYEFYVGDYRH